jgi:hypothetical protein
MIFNEVLQKEAMLAYYCLSRREKTLTGSKVVDPSTIVVSVASSLAAWHGLNGSSEMEFFLRQCILFLLRSHGYRKDRESFTNIKAQKESI